MTTRMLLVALFAMLCSASAAHPQSPPDENRVRRMLTSLIESDGRPDQTTVAWQDARRIILDELAANSDGELAALARRAAARVQVRVTEPVFDATAPASISIDVDPAFLLPGLAYVALIERVLDDGTWQILGWATYAGGGGCGTVLPRALPAEALRAGIHRLDLRAAIALLPPVQAESEPERPCGFAIRDGAPPLVASYDERRTLPTITYGVYVDSPAEVDLEQLVTEEVDNRARQFIEAARTVSATRLDPALPGVPLEDWLDMTIGAFWRVNDDARWRVEECHPRAANRPAPVRRTICAVLYAPVADDRFLELRVVTLAVIVRADGIVWEIQRPAVVVAMLNGYDDSHDLPRLSDLPAALARRKEAWPRINLGFAPKSFRVNVPADRAGEVATFRVVVQNRGRRDAAKAHVRLLLTPCGELQPRVEAEIFRSIPAGKKETVTWKARLPAGVAWTAVAHVEPDYNGPRPIRFDQEDSDNHAALAIGPCQIVQ